MSTTVDLRSTSTESGRDKADERRADRMAELVVELTGCEPTGARHVLRDVDLHAHEDPLALIARAMIAVEQPSPLREPAYLRVG